MSDVVRQLYELQELDLHVAGVEKSLAEHVAKLADKSLLNAARAKLERLEKRLDGLAAERRSVERTVSEVMDSLSALEKRLYGGGITNAQQMAAAEEERTFTISRQGEVEDQLLEFMVAIDDLEPLVDAAKQALSRLEEARPAQEAEWREASARLRDELAVMALEREEVLPLVAAKDQGRPRRRPGREKLVRGVQALAAHGRRAKGQGFVGDGPMQQLRPYPLRRVSPP